MRRKKAVTLVEVVVSSIILVSIFSGLIASFLSVRKLISRSGRRASSTSVARTMMDSMLADVNAVSWDSGNLASGDTGSGTLTIDGQTYNYNHTTSATAYQYRSVSLNVNFPDE